MAENPENAKPGTPISQFERYFVRITTTVLTALVLWFGSTAMSHTEELVGAKGRMLALENDLKELKAVMRDRFTREHADAALLEIRSVQRDHTAGIAYLKGIVECK